MQISVYVINGRPPTVYSIWLLNRNEAMFDAYANALNFIFCINLKII